MPWFTEAPRPWHPVVVVVCRASSRGRGPGRSLQASGSGNLVVVVVVVVEKNVKTKIVYALCTHRGYRSPGKGCLLKTWLVKIDVGAGRSEELGSCEFHRFTSILYASSIVS